MRSPPRFLFPLVAMSASAPFTPGYGLRIPTVLHHLQPMPVSGVVMHITMAMIVMPVPMILRVSVDVPRNWCAVAVVDHWRRSYNDRSVVVMPVAQRNAEADIGTRLRRGRKRRHYDCTQEE